MSDGPLRVQTVGADQAAGELFYGALADHFLDFSNGVEFVYYVFVFNMYKNDVKKAIYALGPERKIVRTFETYRQSIAAAVTDESYDPARHFIFCGDSHVLMFEYLGLNGLLGSDHNLFCRIQGTSAYGLANRDSESGSLREMQTLLNDPVGDPTLVLNMGEVDCRMTLWLIHQSRGAPLDEALNQAISNYRGFVEWLQTRGYEKIALMTVHEPIWLDEEIWTKNAVSRADTQKLTRDFNMALRVMAEELGCNVIDINAQLIDPGSDLPRARFGTIRGEHHLNPERVAPMLLDALNALAGHQVPA